MSVVYLGDDNLGVSFGSQCPRLKQGLVVVDTAPVHVGPGLHIVQRIGNSIEGLKELVIVDVLRLGTNSQLHGLVLGLGVHCLDCCHCCNRLVLVDVPGPEEELPVEVALLVV